MKITKTGKVRSVWRFPLARPPPCVRKPPDECDLEESEHNLGASLEDALALHICRSRSNILEDCQVLNSKLCG
jgi:hypothetical protein